MNAKRQAEKRKPPSFYILGVTRSGIEPRPPAPWADALTTVLRRGGLSEGVSLFEGDYCTLHVYFKIVLV